MTKNKGTKQAPKQGKPETSPEVIQQARTLAREAKRLNGLESKYRATARVASARAVHVAITNGLVGKSSPVKGWGSQQDYAATIGTSPANLTALKRLGYALEVLGCSPEDERWGLLSLKAGDKVIGETITKPGMTRGDLYRVLEGQYTPDGKRNGGTAPRASKNTQPKQPKQVPATTRGDVLEVLRKQIQPGVRGMSRADFDKVMSAMTKFVADETARRDVLDAKEREAADAAAA